MNHEPYAELASAYALGSLDGEERARFEAHLREGCQECEAALADYAETLAAVAAELPRLTPPAAVRTRLLQRVGVAAPRTAPEAPRAVSAPPVRRRPTLWPVVWGAGLAAAAVVAYLAISLGEVKRELAVRAREAAGLEAEAKRLREEAESLRGEVARQRDILALLGAPDTRVVALAGQPPSPAAQGRMWWHPDTHRGFFATSGLPPAPEGKTYQLWVISGGKPLSAGTFGVDPQGHGALAVGPIPEATAPEIFAVTLEPAGGLPAPSGEMYLAGKPA